MSAFFEPATRWWWSRTDRERQMLVVMAFIAAAVLAWLLVVCPAWAWREAAAGRRAEARTTLLQVEAGVRRLAPNADGDQRTKSAASDIEPLVSQSAQAAGLAITTGMDPSGGLGFRADRTTSGQIFPWFAALKAEHGLEVSRLAVVENADATLQVDGGIVP